MKDKKEQGEVHAHIKGKDIKKNADSENPGYFVEQTKSELASELAQLFGPWRPDRSASHFRVPSLPLPQLHTQKQINSESIEHAVFGMHLAVEQTQQQGVIRYRYCMPPAE